MQLHHFNLPFCSNRHLQKTVVSEFCEEHELSRAAGDCCFSKEFPYFVFRYEFGVENGKSMAREFSVYFHAIPF